MSYISLEEAAYLMGMSVENVKKMVESGELLAAKIGSVKGFIHESEMSRFQHPWTHLFRLEQRINAQQALVETLKGKINGGVADKCQIEINNAKFDLSRLAGRVLEMEQKLEPLFDLLPWLVENINSLTAKTKRVPTKSKSKRKKS